MTTNAATPLRIAIIGCGKMAINHVKAIRAAAGASLVAVADPAGVPAKLQAMLPPEAKWFATAEAMLDAVKPDVVHIVTPPATHGPLARLCVARGAHVYVEKPFTVTSADARDVLEAASAAGRLVCAGHQLLSEGPARALAAARHRIGEVVHVESYFSFRTVRKATDGRTLMSPVEQLIDILPHPVYTVLDQLTACAPGAQAEITALEVQPEGDVRAWLRAGPITAVLVVSLRGRPVESYLRVVGLNGSLRADFVRGALIDLAGAGTSAIALMMNPYREAGQILVRSTKGFGKRILERKKGYPGLNELFDDFYHAVRARSASPHTPTSILDTVRICEQVGDALKRAEAAHETRAAAALEERERQMAPADASRGLVLVTGGTGLLGREVVRELRGRGWAVRATARRMPAPSSREPGIQYVLADLGNAIDPSILAGVSTVVHCAAETAGGQEAHEKNTIAATSNLLRASAAAGVKRFVHVSSIAVLKPGREVGGIVSEKTPVDLDNLGRGPYVWAKAESERQVLQEGPALGMGVRVMRPGPLVAYAAYQPPGRLGRELGPLFVAIGPKHGGLSVCEVKTGAQVLRAMVEDFDAMPPVVNMVEPTAPTRAELLDRWLAERPDLHAFWLPAWVLAVLSPVAKLAQRLLLGSKNPIDVAAAFSSERYDTTLAAEAVRRARQAPAPASAEMRIA